MVGADVLVVRVRAGHADRLDAAGQEAAELLVRRGKRPERGQPRVRLALPPEPGRDRVLCAGGRLGLPDEREDRRGVGAQCVGDPHVGERQLPVEVEPCVRHRLPVPRDRVGDHRRKGLVAGGADAADDGLAALDWTGPGDAPVAAAGLGLGEAPHAATISAPISATKGPRTARRCGTAGVWAGGQARLGQCSSRSASAFVSWMVSGAWAGGA